MIEDVSAEAMIWALARRLYDYMEHLDPSEAPSWEEADELERCRFRSLVLDVIENYKTMFLSLGGPGDNIIHGHPEARE